jgi:hypothetical protein
MREVLSRGAVGLVILGAGGTGAGGAGGTGAGGAGGTGAGGQTPDRRTGQPVPLLAPR